MNWEILCWILSILLVLGGLIGTLLPIIPGPLLVYVGLFLVAWIDRFTKVGGVTLVVLGLLMVAAFVVDFLASMLGAQRFGASRSALVGALIGTFIGIFLGLFGLLLGPFLGAFLGEYVVRRDLRRSSQIGLGTWLGILLGTLAKLAIVFSMLGIFVWTYWI